MLREERESHPGGHLVGLPLGKACALVGTNRDTFQGWMRTRPELRERYEQAKLERTDALEEEIHTAHDDLPDDCTSAQVQRNKEQASNRRWLAQVTQPAKYSEKHMIGVQDLTPDKEDRTSKDILAEIAEAFTVPDIDPVQLAAEQVARDAALGLNAGRYANFETAMIAESRAHEPRDTFESDDGNTIDLRSGADQWIAADDDLDESGPFG